MPVVTDVSFIKVTQIVLLDNISTHLFRQIVFVFGIPINHSVSLVGIGTTFLIRINLTPF